MYLNIYMNFIDIKSTLKDVKWIILWLYRQMASLEVQVMFIYIKVYIYIHTYQQ